MSARRHCRAAERERSLSGKSGTVSTHRTVRMAVSFQDGQAGSDRFCHRDGKCLPVCSSAVAILEPLDHLSYAQRGLRSQSSPGIHKEKMPTDQILFQTLLVLDCLVVFKTWSLSGSPGGPGA